MSRALLTTLFICISGIAISQTVLDTKIDGVSQNIPLKNFLVDFEKNNPVKFFFLEDWLSPYIITPTDNGKILKEALTDILGQEVRFTLMFDYAVVFSVDPKIFIHSQELIQNAIAQKWDLEEIVIGDKEKRSLSKSVTIRGVVKSEADNRALAGVIIELENGIQTVTDVNGQYELLITQGEHVVTYKMSEYNEKLIILKIYQNGTLNISLGDNPVFLDEVVITDQRLKDVKVGQSTIRISDIKRAPTFLGEVDLVKSIQSQPGTTTVSELATGFNVRGGSADQNLVLYDGVAIFNTSHALGFFSAFNSNAIRNVSFYRGGIPVQYGGRASSVMDVTSAEGNPNKWKLSGGIGFISTDINVGGPIKQDTTLITASVRTSYSDWILNTVKSKYDLQKSSLSFYDASIKVSHKFNSKTKITFSGYTSSDRFTLINDTSYHTRNFAASLKLDKTFDERLSGSIALDFGKYAYTIGKEDRFTGFELDYSITYPSLKIDFNYDGKHKLAFGIHNTFYTFNPGILGPTSGESNSNAIHMPEARALESGIYFSDAFQVSDKLFIEAGLRYSLFNRMGAATVYEYASGRPREQENIIDSTKYGKNEIVKTYMGIEPRFSARYELTENSSLKMGYNRMNQYLHMITNTAAITPIDIWHPSDPHFRPQIADQISLGYYKSTKKETYEVSAEVFYKEIKNVLDFKDGAELVLNKYLETALLKGKSTNYGIEFSVSKVQGKLIASGNYTYSRSLRQVNGKFDSEKINDGKIYPSNFDQPHIVNVNWRYGITKRVFFSGNFTYHTGRPISFPVSSYSVDGTPIADFSERNKYRIPDYHRMDIAFIIEASHKKRKRVYDGNWVVSFYNVYARKNVYTVFFASDENGNLRPYKLSVIGAIIPSVTYRFTI